MAIIIRKPNRLEHFSYSTSAWYFVTFCTYNRINLFGSVNNSAMHLNEYGKIAEIYLKEIPSIYDFIELDEYIIMPNHEHIILINNKDSENDIRSNMIVSRVIQQYKSICTKKIRNICGNSNINVWQHSFYDRIIRNEKELEKIRNYIALNPLKWELEKNNPENLLM